MLQLKNFRTIGLKMIDEFQANTPSKQYFNDPRFTMSDVDLTCSLLRKELRKGHLTKSLYPNSIKGVAFDNLISNLNRVLDKIRTVQNRYRAN